MKNENVMKGIPTYKGIEILKAVPVVTLEGVDLGEHGIREIRDVSKLGDSVNQDTYIAVMNDGMWIPFVCAREQIKMFIEGYLNKKEQ